MKYLTDFQTERYFKTTLNQKGWHQDLRVVYPSGDAIVESWSLCWDRGFRLDNRTFWFVSNSTAALGLRKNLLPPNWNVITC